MPRCKNCREVYNQYEFNNKFCLSIDCQTQKALFKLGKIKKQTAKDWKAKKKVLKEKLKAKSDYEKEAQPIINKIARLIDKGSNCMMCNNIMKRTNGCHYHSVGSSPTIRFNLFNIWIGCHSCNGEKGGNIIGYDNRLIDVYNRERWEYIKFDIVRETAPIHLTIDDLKQLKKESSKIVRELEKLDLTYSIELRWKLRDKFNKRLGIYL